MPENYKKVLTGMMKNRNVGRFLGLEKKQQAVLDVMAAQKITMDPSKLPGYKRNAFLKAVKGKIGIGYDAKKAIQSVYGENKTVPVKTKPSVSEENMARRRTYDEIMHKRNARLEQKTDSQLPKGSEHAKILNFSQSNKGLRAADKIVADTKEIKHSFYDSMYIKEENEDALKARLREIQD